MEINISYIGTKHYDRTNIIQWVWMFKRYTYVKGFIMRVFGIYINVRENNAIEKLAAKAQKMLGGEMALFTNKGGLRNVNK